jgi:hypothetical protein
MTLVLQFLCSEMKMKVNSIYYPLHHPHEKLVIIIRIEFPYL